MDENKMSKQIVSLDVDYSSKKEGKSNAILLKIRKGRMEWVLYDSSIVCNILYLHKILHTIKNEILKAYLPWNKNIQY